MEAVSTRACKGAGVEPGVWERPWPLPHERGPRRYERGFFATFLLAAFPAFLATVFFACVFAADVFALVFFAAARFVAVPGRAVSAFNSIHVGAWSLAFSRSRTQRSTPASISRGCSAGLSS